MIKINQDKYDIVILRYHCVLTAAAYCMLLPRSSSKSPADLGRKMIQLGKDSGFYWYHFPSFLETAAKVATHHTPRRLVTLWGLREDLKQVQGLKMFNSA